MTRPCAARRGHDQAVVAWCHLIHQLVNEPRTYYGLIRNHPAKRIHVLTVKREAVGCDHRRAGSLLGRERQQRH